ncbi:MAG: hypothetical protein MK212_10680 [Saprospiraceae bacterium]|nr:hypothetical protein [Saprospiraceae bacterium]
MNHVSSYLLIFLCLNLWSCNQNKSFKFSLKDNACVRVEDMNICDEQLNFKFYNSDRVDIEILQTSDPMTRLLRVKNLTDQAIDFLDFIDIPSYLSYEIPKGSLWVQETAETKAHAKCVEEKGYALNIFNCNESKIVQLIFYNGEQIPAQGIWDIELRFDQEATYRVKLCFKGLGDPIGSWNLQATEQKITELIKITNS